MIKQCMSVLLGALPKGTSFPPFWKGFDLKSILLVSKGNESGKKEPKEHVNLVKENFGKKLPWSFEIVFLKYFHLQISNL